MTLKAEDRVDKINSIELCLCISEKTDRVEPAVITMMDI